MCCRHRTQSNHRLPSLPLRSRGHGEHVVSRFGIRGEVGGEGGVEVGGGGVVPELKKKGSVGGSEAILSILAQTIYRADAKIDLQIRLAVVTGGNRGVGLEVCRQLALQDVMVILTARDEKRGKDAVESIRHESNLSNIIFHQLDVRDNDSVASLARYIESRYGKLDILVNNAAVIGVAADEEGLKALNIDAETWTSGRAANMLKAVFQNTYDEAATCFNTNYYGYKRVTEALLPLLKLSTSGARIVNASSLASELKRMPNEKLRNELSNIDIWDEERVEAVLNTFLEDLKNGRLEEAGWPKMLPAYSVSKMAINLYTRLLARQHPEMRINCVRPGFVKTDINFNLGILTPEQGARGLVMLALLPEDGPTGLYFDQTEVVNVW